MTEKLKQIAIFGGTFDPIHLGHLLIAEQAYNSFSLDKIIFMPAGIPPHKIGKQISSGRHRLEMVRRAIEKNPHFELSDWELRQDRKSFTVDTLRHFESLELAEKIYFIVGADSLLDIINWRESYYILEHAHIIAASRPGFSLPDIFRDKKLAHYRHHIHLMDSLLIEISSSLIREMNISGRSIRYLTLPEVISYIEEQALYRGEADGR